MCLANELKSWDNIQMFYVHSYVLEDELDENSITNDSVTIFDQFWSQFNAWNEWFTAVHWSSMESKSMFKGQTMDI